MFFILALSIISIDGYSSMYISQGGRNTWIFTIISSLILIFYGYFLFLVCNKTKTYDFKKIIYSSLGTKIGNFYLFLFGICLILSAIECASVNASTIHTNLFLETPIWFLLIFFIASTFYCLTKPLDTLLILVISLISIAIFSGIFIEILVFKYVDFKNLFPVFETSFNLHQLKCIIYQIGAMSSFILAFPLISNVQDKKNLKKYSLFIFCFIAQISIYLMITIIGTFGANRAGNIFYPKLIQSQKVYYGGFLENGELFILFQIILNWSLKYLISLNILFELFKEKFKNKNFFACTISIIIFVACCFFSENILFLINYLKIYQYINFIVLFAFPLIIFSIYLLKNKTKSS